MNVDSLDLKEYQGLKKVTYLFLNLNFTHLHFSYVESIYIIQQDKHKTNVNKHDEWLESANHSLWLAS